MQALACHCDYTSDSSQHARSGNYVRETHVPGTISSEECARPTEVGSRNGRSFHTIDCDNINSNLISIRYGKSKRVSKTQKVCCIVKTFPLTPVKTTHHTIVVPEVFLSFFTSCHISPPHHFEERKVEFLDNVLFV